MIGIRDATPGGYNGGLYLYVNGSLYEKGIALPTGYDFAISSVDTLGVAMNLDNKTIKFSKNGVFGREISITSTNYKGIVYPSFSSGGGTWEIVTATANFGQTPFKHNAPEGYLPYDNNKIKHIVKSSNRMKTLSNDGVWKDLDIVGNPTALQFETVGMSDLIVITEEQWAELEKPIDIYTWTDQENATSIKVNHSQRQYISPTIELTVPNNVILFAVSIDKLIYKVYKNNEWFTINKTNVLSQGMTRKELEETPQSAWEELFDNQAYLSSFDIFVGLFSLEINKPIMKSIAIEYAENKSPIITNAIITPDSVHNEYATISANIKDYEGDKVSFKIMIKKADELDFVQVSPDDGWFDRTSSNTEMTQSFNHPYFSKGLNEIKLVVKDERGLENEWSGNITYLNSAPTMLITHDSTKMTAVIGDEDGDSISYRVFINGEMKFDYTDLLQTPTELNYYFDSSNIVIGENNEIKIEVKDSHGAVISETINVVGAYRGLMFKDELGKYYTSDFGEIINLLDLGTIIAGQSTEVKKVLVQNCTGENLQNISLKGDSVPLPESIKILLSNTENPFVGKESIVIPSIVRDKEEKEIFVQIKTEAGNGLNSNFKVTAEADVVS
jgi:hypothetical protein